MLSIDPRLIRAPNMSCNSVSVALRDMSIAASITTVARNIVERRCVVLASVAIDGSHAFVGRR